MSAENKISKFIHSYKFQDSEVKTLAKKGEFASFLSKLFQMRDQVGFQDVPTRLQSCFGGAPSVDAHSEQIFISFIIDHHHYVILHLKFICSHSQLLERNLSFFFISSVRSSNSHPDLLLTHHHPTPPHFFRSHRSSTLDFHFLSQYSYIKAMMLYKGHHWT